MNEINKNVISNSDNKIRLGSLNSHSGSSTGINTYIPRKDIYGNIISKKAKKHRISFADQIENSKAFVEIKMVNSYKEYNRYGSSDDDKWSCIVF
jgi:ribosomal protein RSM22 (predicted rRNA methylase)